MSIKDKLQADLDQARTDLADAQARVDSLTQQIGNIPPEVEAIAEEAWDRVVAFFKAL